MKGMRKKHKWFLFLLFIVSVFAQAFATFGSNATIFNQGSSPVTVQISCTSGQGYTCFAIKYSVDGNSWQNYYGADLNVVLTEDGNHIIRYYAIGRACYSEKCTHVFEPMKYVWAYVVTRVSPTIILNSPIGGELWRGIHAIDFNVRQPQNNELHLAIYYSSDRNKFQNVIVSDLNLNNYPNIAALNCDGSNWSNSTRCTYDWNTAIIPDGNWYIDLNIWERKYFLSDSNSTFSHLMIDNNPPFTNLVSPTGWQTQDFNVVLSCSDASGSGCASTSYGLNFGPWETYGQGVSEWWNSSWQYRRKIFFDNSNQPLKTNHSVLLRLNSGNFDFSKVQSAGQDLRFRDVNQQIAIEFFFDYFNAALQSAIVWIKVPQIDANSKSDYVWMYYGNPSATDAQSTNWFG
ncbi:MAG: DUF2341 domain-containing protein [Candidatus Diapherotrites archaeon]